MEPAENQWADDGSFDPYAAQRRGRGRRYIEHEDHKVTRSDHNGASRFEHPELGISGHGRRNIQPEDSVKAQLVHLSHDDGAPKGPPSLAEMKDSVREWITAVHGMMVFDERRWEDAELKARGSLWAIEAFNPQRKTLSREGQTARAIAEKLSMMPVTELRHFGVRFATGGELAQPVQSPAARREKRSPFDDNPTLVSPGVHGAFCTAHGEGALSPAGARLSTVRKDPEAQQRRYIASGVHNFEACGQPASHTTGHARDTDFSDGIERGIGRGRRYIGSKDNVHGVLQQGDLRPEESAALQAESVSRARRGGYGGYNGNGHNPLF